MILVESASASSKTFEQASLLAHLLRKAGVDAWLDCECQPETLPSSMRYEAATMAIDAANHVLDGLILLDCHKLSHARVASLHQYDLAPNAKVVAIGSFDGSGQKMSATAQISYATGHTPQTIDLSDHPMVHAAGSTVPCLGIPVEQTPWPPLGGRAAVQIFAPDINGVQNQLQAITTVRSMVPLVYTSSSGKAAWLKAFGPGAHVMSYGEILPTRLATMGRVLILAGNTSGNYRGLTFLNTHLASGSAVIDATPDGSYLAEGYPVLRGPADLSYLPAYLRETILPNIDGISEMSHSASVAGKLSPGAVLGSTGLLPVAQTAAQSASPTPIAPQAPTTWFMPTNGHGLGHAQRCTLVAEALRDGEGTSSGFLAFPSCLDMIRARGFDAVPLVSRSQLHRHSTANDEVNFLRLRSTLGPGHTFVFDGGYIFDSVTRSILEHNLAAVWIRRGLWTSAQDNTIPLDRERYFSRVIVPREGLADLNRSVSGGEAVREVGPIVRLLTEAYDRDAMRAALAQRFGKFDELIVTMLGSGVYLDISTQLQLVAGFAEGRKNCLNLVVVWPSSQTPAARFAWSKSRVVTTRNATALAGAADVVVSAAGYNSYHETLYNRIPTIFVPQVAAWLDDQIARAELAAEKGLGACITPERPGRVTRELSLFLDRGKADDVRAALRALELPAPGTQDAARLIAEVGP